MTPELQKTLQQLAEKLGVGIDRLWACLVKQAPLDSVVNVFSWVSMAVVIAVSIKYFCKFYQKMIDHPHDDWGIAAFVSATTAVIFAVILMVTFGTNASLTLAGFFNPDYWALHQILHP